MAIAAGALIGTASTLVGDPGTTLSVTTSGAASAGSRVFLVLTHYNNSNAAVASASGGGLTWVNDGVYSGTTDANYRVTVISADAPAGLASSTAISITWSLGVFGRWVAVWYATGVATGASGYLDGATQGGTGTGTAWSTGSKSVTGEALVIGGGWSDFQLTSTTPTVGTEISDFSNTSNNSTHWAQYSIQPSAGSVNVAGTLAAGSGSNPWNAGVVAYKSDAAAAAAPVLGQSFNPIPFMR